jgi:hypothetical protein
LPDKVTLYMFPGSNSALTGRLLLDHKGIDYKLVKLPPAAHAFILLALGFETMAVPALKIGGRRVQGHAGSHARSTSTSRSGRCIRPTRSDARQYKKPSAGARAFRTRRGGSSTAPPGATAGRSRASCSPSARPRCASPCGSPRR